MVHFQPVQMVDRKHSDQTWQEAQHTTINMFPLTDEVLCISKMSCSDAVFLVSMETLYSLALLCGSESYTNIWTSINWAGH